MLDLIYNIEEIFRFCGSFIGTVIVNFKNSMSFMNDCIFNVAAFIAILPDWIQKVFLAITCTALITKFVRLKG